MTLIVLFYCDEDEAVGEGGFAEVAYSLTYLDLIEHVTDWLGGNAEAKVQRDIQRSILDAYREFTESYAWVYFREKVQIDLEAPYSTGTITFDKTGGSSENLLTLASGTWPSWAANGSVRIANVVYYVRRRTSDTLLELDADISPAADIAAGTSYQLFQSRYPLPESVRTSSKWYSEGNWFRSSYVGPDELLGLERNTEGTGDPIYWAIIGDINGRNQRAVWFYPAPAQSRSLVTMNNRRPEELRVTGLLAAHSQGTISNTAEAVTGTSTAFNSTMVGSLLRISNTADKPTGIYGSNPFAAEPLIRSVESTTALTLETDPGVNYSLQKYVITDPIDIEPAHENALKRCCEKTIVQHRPERSELFKQTQALYVMELRKAKASEAPHTGSRQVGGMRPGGRRLANWGNDGYA